jgi:sulfate/thiosulfate transport system permease protein
VTRRGFALPSALPGFGPSFATMMLWLSLLVLAPLAALALRPWTLGISGVLASLAEPRVFAALRLSTGTAILAALINLPLGLLLAWVLVRFRFPGRRLMDATIDLPLALPTAVAGITLTTLYGPNGWIGAPLAALGIKVAYTPLGILVALVFVGLPFVVRAVEPVLRDVPFELEEAAETLGARPHHIFRRVLLPVLAPALLTGFSLAFARGIGEYGSVVFISGNMPMRTEIAPLLIVIRLQQFNYAGAAAVGLAMLLCSAICLALVAVVQRWMRPVGMVP